MPRYFHQFEHLAWRELKIKTSKVKKWVFIESDDDIQ
jgi:hypothetical protein